MSCDVQRPRGRAALLAGVGLLGWAVGLPAHAALGGSEASVEADRLHVDATQRVLRMTAYSVHEMQTPSGTVVREFVSPEGIVFGVAWQGPSMPDLRQVLGSYFDRYVSAVTQRKARGPITIAQPGLVVQSSGHQRAFVGRAYIPEALPPGIGAESIK